MAYSYDRRAVAALGPEVGWQDMSPAQRERFQRDHQRKRPTPRLIAQLDELLGPTRTYEGLRQDMIQKGYLPTIRDPKLKKLLDLTGLPTSGPDKKPAKAYYRNVAKGEWERSGAKILIQIDEAVGKKVSRPFRLTSMVAKGQPNLVGLLGANSSHGSMDKVVDKIERAYDELGGPEDSLELHSPTGDQLIRARGTSWSRLF